MPEEFGANFDAVARNQIVTDIKFEKDESGRIVRIIITRGQLITGASPDVFIRPTTLETINL